MTALLAVNGLAKRFGGVDAVSHCSFEVAEREVLGLIGPNGAGKSTVIGLVSGFVRPDRGSVVFDGADVTKLPVHARARRGLVRSFQLARVWGALSVMENMLVAATPPASEAFFRQFGLGRRGRVREEAYRVRAREVLESFDLLRLKDAPAGSLSGGQKRLVEFARILMYRPRLVLLDEPTASLSPAMSQRIGEGIEVLAAEGISVVLIEHDVDLVERVCPRVVCMASGTVIAEGSMDALRRDRSVVTAYLGATVEPERPGSRRRDEPIASEAGR
jgi:ABC-type branched-subunit amino acid transport system ATPase component